jgi:hypothetical protein
VGGVKGRQFVMSVDLLSGRTTKGVVRRGPFVALWPVPSSGGAVCSTEGTLGPVHRPRGRRRKTVLIAVGAEAGKFEDFVPRAEKC